MAVTLDVWRVPRRAVPAALGQVAWLPRRLRRAPDTGFVKLLGTGRGREFGPTAADLGRWAALTVWNGPSRPVRGFDRIASAHCRLTLRPLASRGRWAGCEPFAGLAGDGAGLAGGGGAGLAGGGAGRSGAGGPLLVLTRARLRPSRAAVFWRAIGPVAAALREAPGLLTAFGVGEAPVGFQGTVSVWADASAANRFAYRTAEHADVVAATPSRGWYAEELFARLAVLDVAGDREVIGWNGEPA